MILNATTRKIQVVLGEAKTTNDCPIVADYFDSGVTPAGAASFLNSNGVTAVDAVPAPAAGYTRIVNSLTLNNKDTVSHTATVRFNDNGTTYDMFKATLPPGYTLVYTKSEGWSVLSTTGLYVAGQIPGTTTNDNAAAGMVGEYLSSTVLVGAAIALGTGTPSDITHITLTPGDWDVWGTVDFQGTAGCAATAMLGWLSSSSATFPTRPNNGAMISLQITFGTNVPIDVPVGVARFSVAANTNIFLTAQSAFSGGSGYSAYGFIGARRVR